MANPAEAPAGPVGRSVFCVPQLEDDPDRPGRKRVKRDTNHNIVYTPESEAAYVRYVEAQTIDQTRPGPQSDINPVHAFYRAELEYQRDASKVRPKSGPHAHRVEIPKDVLKLLERETAEKKR